MRKNPNVQKIDDFIQAKLRELGLKSVTPVEATHWLIEAGFREKLESRPGSYVRGLCRKGVITGAEQVNKSWRIKRANLA